MTIRTIQIEGLPEGWEVESIVIAPRNSNDDPMTALAEVKLKKSKPRRIVLEETEEDNEEYHYLDDSSYYAGQYIKNLANQGGLMIEFVQPVSNYVLIEYEKQCIGSIKNKKKKWLLTLDGIVYLPTIAYELIFTKMKELQGENNATKNT